VHIFLLAVVLVEVLLQKKIGDLRTGEFAFAEKKTCEETIFFYMARTQISFFFFFARRVMSFDSKHSTLLYSVRRFVFISI